MGKTSVLSVINFVLIIAIILFLVYLYYELKPLIDAIYYLEDLFDSWFYELLT